MYTADELQRILGVSRKQLRARLRALEEAGLLQGQYRAGPRGRREYSVSVLQMLREVEEEARVHGLPLRQAALEVAKRVRPAGPSPEVGANTAAELSAELARLQGLVDALREQVQMLRAENERLWAQVQKLLGMLEAQRALPAPRKPWWKFWA